MVSDKKTRKNGIQPIQDLTLREKVYSQIKQLILTNKFYPGQVLVIDHIAADLGLSHTPVREALAMLELDGLVSINQHRNPNVADITTADIEELYEMRLLLEPWAIKHSSLNIPIEDIIEIEGDLRQAFTDAENHDYAAHLASDIRLHQLILCSTGNQLFWQLASRVNDQSIRIRSLAESTSTNQDVLSIIQEHFEITEAIKMRDSFRAYEKIVNHLRSGKERTLSALNKIPKGSGYHVD